MQETPPIVPTVSSLPDAPQTNSPKVSKAHSKVGTTWITLVVFVLLLLLLVIFILHNSMTVHIQYLGAHGSLSFGVALIIAAIAGSLLTILIGTVRILQLKLEKKHSKINYDEN